MNSTNATTTTTSPTASKSGRPTGKHPHTLQFIQAVAEHAPKAGPGGFKRDDICMLLGISAKQAKCAIAHARAAGHVHTIGTGSATRHFASAEWAQHYCKPTPQKQASKKDEPRPLRDSLANNIEATRQAIINAGNAGISTPDLAKAIKRDRKVVRHAIHMGKLGHSVRRGNTLLHFATSEQAKACRVDPNAHLARHKPKSAPPAKSSNKHAAPPAPPMVLAATSPALPAPVVIRIKALQGEGIHTDAATYVQAPAPQPRISTKDADMLFKTLQPGNYLKADTWASRHLAARQP